MILLTQSQETASFTLRIEPRRHSPRYKETQFSGKQKTSLLIPYSSKVSQGAEGLWLSI
jgi:hypothetical protein